jgi:Fic-DOC domain mobile mystery protein B
VAIRFEYPPGATPIDPEEIAGLVPMHLTLQGQLNEYEEANILEATEWVFSRRRGDPLAVRFLHTVHRRMFNQTWMWAGQARRSDKNLGVPWMEIGVHLRQLLGDVRTQIESRSYPPVEIAARYHHRLVTVHVFPNGNGRHARLMADLLLTDLVGQRFEWGRGSLMQPGELRAQYIGALRAADSGDIRPLLAFLAST